MQIPCKKEMHKINYAILWIPPPEYIEDMFKWKDAQNLEAQDLLLYLSFDVIKSLEETTDRLNWNTTAYLNIIVSPTVGSLSYCA